MAEDRVAASGHGSTVFQWLIERGQPEGEPEAVWLENSAAHPASHRRWTDDAHSAAMFPTKETAEAYIAEEGLSARVVEHGFLSRAGLKTEAEILTSQQAAQAIVRERETRHWTIGQRREAFGEHWPWETARITSDADAAVDWYMEALAQIRSAWNFHFERCPEPLLPISPPTVEQVNAWLNAPSDTASA